MISPLDPNPKIVGLRILQSLAANSGNVRAITGTPSCVANITNLLDFHRHSMHTTSFKHDMPSVTAASASLVLIRRLVDQDFSLSDTPIIATDNSTFSVVIAATRRILICHLCDRSLQTEAMNMLQCLLLLQPPGSSVSGWSELYGKIKIINVLREVFALGRNDYSRQLAGEKLAMLSSELNAPIVFDQVKKFVASLKGILADDARDSEYGYGCRIQAARILKNLCSHSCSSYPSRYLQTLKEALVHAVPQVCSILSPLNCVSSNRIFPYPEPLEPD